MKNLIALIFAITTLYSCNNSSEEKKEKYFTELMVETKSIKEVSKECSQINPRGCARIKASFPILKNKGKNSINERLKPINDSIYSIFSQSFIDFIPEGNLKWNTPIDHLMASFFKKHKKDQKINSEGIGYELINDVTIPYKSDNYISIRQDLMTYAGGAHPDSEILFYTLDLSSGKKMEAYSWIEDTNAVKSLLLKLLKEKVNIDQEMDLEEFGFFISDNEFLLTHNILVQKDSVSFAYNSYELGSYSFGNFDLKLPKSAVKLKN